MTTLLDLMGDGGNPRPRAREAEVPIVSFVRLESPGEKAVKRCRGRMGWLAAGFSILFLAVLGKLTQVMVLGDTASGRVFEVARQDVPAFRRADMVDRNGTLIATNLTTASVYAEPRFIRNPHEAAQGLASALSGVDAGMLETELKSGRRFIWIKRNITPREKYAVNTLGIPGIDFLREEQRVYPQGELLAHVLGYVDVDNHGIAGIERGLEKRLADPKRNQEPVALSIDLNVQAAIRDVLSEGMEKYQAKGAAGIVADIKTGEILGLVSLPDFDSNHHDSSTPDQRFNRATLGVYELGSTFKTFTMAMALDSGAVKLTDQFDTKPISYGRFTIRDAHTADHPMSLPEVFMRSSNIGTVHIAQRVGVERQRDFLLKLGMLEPLELELPEMGKPMTPSPWKEIQMMTVAFGHGISVSPLHLVHGVSALVGDGKVRPLTLIKVPEGAPVQGERVIRDETVKRMRALMRLVVAEGTGKRANATRYLIGGKTGTAEKSVAGGYNRRALISSFIGAFPIDRPRYAVFAMFDEPGNGAASWGRSTASMNAAPAVRAIVERIGPLLDVTPTPTEETKDAQMMRDSGIRLTSATFHAD